MHEVGLDVVKQALVVSDYEAKQWQGRETRKSRPQQGNQKRHETKIKGNDPDSEFEGIIIE